ncbi:hypothetical protein VaNZ11_006322 [Volvox africanus]|uniref:Protein kinase domain-containing protein n=1 Tax=Volvox africanus TaxID=51714 RepID=A0ABQ5S1V5_9CHLO|nr:hypothetical protein VaNZ11_006322 [Volvox africanus]
MDELLEETTQSSCSCFPFWRNPRRKQAGNHLDLRGKPVSASLTSRVSEGATLPEKHGRSRQDREVGEALSSSAEATKETRVRRLQGLPKNNALLDSLTTVSIIPTNVVYVKEPLKVAKAQIGCPGSGEGDSPSIEHVVNGHLTQLSRQLTREQLIVTSTTIATSPDATISPTSPLTTPSPQQQQQQQQRDHPNEDTIQVAHLATFRRASSNAIPTRKPFLLGRPQLSAGDRPGSGGVSIILPPSATSTAAGTHPAITLSPSTASSFTLARSNTGGVMELGSSQLPTLPSALSHPATTSTSEQRFQYTGGTLTGVGGAGGPDILSSILSEGCQMPLGSSYLPSGELSRFQSLQAGISSMLNADTGHISTTAVEQLRQQILSEQQQGAGGRPIEVDNLEKVGHGSYGLVYRGVWQGALVAIKYLVSSSTQQLQISATEALLSKLLAHPNVVQTFACKVLELTSEFFQGEATCRSSGGTARHVNSGCTGVEVTERLAGLPAGDGDGGVPQPYTSNPLGSSSCGAEHRIRRLHTAVANAANNDNNSPRRLATTPGVVAAMPGVTATSASQPPPPPPRRRHCSCVAVGVIEPGDSPLNTPPSCSRLRSSGHDSVATAVATVHAAGSTLHLDVAPVLLIPPGTAAIALDISLDTSSDPDPGPGPQPDLDPNPDLTIVENRRLLQTHCLQRLRGSSFCRGTGGTATTAQAAREPDGCGSPASAPACGLSRQARSAQLVISQSSPFLGLNFARTDGQFPAASCGGCGSDQVGSWGGGTVRTATAVVVGGVDGCFTDLGLDATAAATEQTMTVTAASAKHPVAAAATDESADHLGAAELLASFQSGDGFGAPYLEATDKAQPLQDTVAKYRELLSQIQAKPGDFLTQIVMEFCDRGSLQWAIDKNLFRASSRWNARVALRAMLRTAREIAQGMCHLHASQIMHGDLKPANVLLKSSRSDRRGFIAKVADFGLSKIVHTKERSSLECPADATGTIAYMAPEVLNGSMSPAADIYSFGVMLWQLVTGEKPFGDVHPGRVFVGVCSGALQLEWPPDAHPMVRKLGEACLSSDKRQRPSFTKVARVLGVIETVVRNEGAAAAAVAVAPVASAGVSAAAPQPFMMREASGGGMPLGPSVGVNTGKGQIGSDGAGPMVCASIQMTSSVCAANVGYAGSMPPAQDDSEGGCAAVPTPPTAAAGFPASLAPIHSGARQHRQQRLLMPYSRTARSVTQAMVLGDAGAMAAAGSATGTARHRGGGALTRGFLATTSTAPGGAGSPTAPSPNTLAMPTAWMMRGSPSGSCSYSYSLLQAPCENSSGILTDPTPRSASVTVARTAPAMQQHPYGAFPHGVALDGSATRPPNAPQISASNAGGSGGLGGVMPMWPAHFMLSRSDLRLQANCIIPPQPPSSPQQTLPSIADSYGAASGGPKPGGGFGGGLKPPYNVQHVYHPSHIGVHGGYPTAGPGGHFHAHGHHYLQGSYSQRPHHQYPQLQLAWQPGQGPAPQAQVYLGQVLPPQPSPPQQEQRPQDVQLQQVQQSQPQQQPVRSRQHDQDLPQQQQREQEGADASGQEVRLLGVLKAGCPGCWNTCAQPLPLPLPLEEQAQQWQSAACRPVQQDPEPHRQGAVGTGNGNKGVGSHARGPCAASIMNVPKDAFMGGSVAALAAAAAAGVGGSCGGACAHDTGASCEVAPAVASSARANTKGCELESQDMLPGLLPAGRAAAGLPAANSYLPMYPLLYPQSHHHQDVLTHSHSHPNVSQPLHGWVSVVPHHVSGSGFTGSTGGPVGGIEQRLIHGAGFSPPLAAAGAAAQGGVFGPSLLESASFFSTQPHVTASPSPLCGGMISPYFTPYMSCISPSATMVCSSGPVWTPLRGALGSIAAELDAAAESIAMCGITAECGTSAGASAAATGDGSAMCAGACTKSFLVAAASNPLAGDGDLSVGSQGYGGSASQTIAAQTIAAAQSTLAEVKLPDDHALMACLQQMCSPGISNTWPFPAAAGLAMGPGNVMPGPLVSLSLTPTSTVSQLGIATAKRVMADQLSSLPPPPSRMSHEPYAAGVAQPPPPYSSTICGLNSVGGSVAAVATTVPYRNVDHERERDVSPALHGLQRHAILEGDEEGL